MADRPIIFPGPEVRAILEGRKTQARRVLKPQPDPGQFFGSMTYLAEMRKLIVRGGMAMRQDISVPHAIGDRLWVRERCRAEELSRPPKKRKATPKEQKILNRLWVEEFDELDGIDGIRYVADNLWLPIENTQDASYKWSDLYHYKGEGKNGVGNIVPAIHMPRWASRITLCVTDVRVQRLQDISERDAEAEGVEPLLVPPDGGGAPHVEGFRDLWNTLNTKRGHSWDSNPWVVAITFEREE